METSQTSAAEKTVYPLNPICGVQAFTCQQLGTPVILEVAVILDCKLGNTSLGTPIIRGGLLLYLVEDSASMDALLRTAIVLELY